MAKYRIKEWRKGSRAKYTPQRKGWFFWHDFVVPDGYECKGFGGVLGVRYVAQQYATHADALARIEQVAAPESTTYHYPNLKEVG
jgi:hypothetical protein